VTTPFRRIVAGLVTATALSLPLSVTATIPADAASYHYKNCAQLHKKFKHGVGKKHATDHHTKTSKPVTNFKRSTKIYTIAVKYHPDLDRDKDGIACEKH
jgi:hypothetical protein